MTSKRVLLAGVIKNGGQLRSNGPSNQNFLALDCLLGEEPFPAGEPPVIDTMTVHLKGLEDWLRLGSVKVSKTKNTITTKYKRPKKATYKFDHETLAIEFGVDGSYQGIKTRRVTFDERALLARLIRQRAPERLASVV